MAKIAQKEGQYEESNEWADKALEFYSEVKQDYNWPELLKIKSDNYAHLGNEDYALNELQRYVQTSDSIARLINTKQINVYRVQYEVAKKEKELAIYQMQYSKLRLAILGIFLIAVLIISGGIIYFRKRNKYYALILKQNKEGLRREEDLKKQILNLEQAASSKTPASSEEGEDNTHASANKSNSSNQSAAVAETLNKIFDRIMEEMAKGEIWRDPNVTRESFAELIQCNRTYFSQAIKLRTGYNYNRFMNNYRIHEAVKILSDPSDNTPFEVISRNLGFMSESTFYTSFKQEIGMTPAAYRKMSRTENQ